MSTGPRTRGCEAAVGRSTLFGAFAAGTPKRSSKRNCGVNDSLVRWWSIMCNFETLFHWRGSCNVRGSRNNAICNVSSTFASLASKWMMLGSHPWYLTGVKGLVYIMIFWIDTPLSHVAAMIHPFTANWICVCPPLSLNSRVAPQHALTLWFRLRPAPPLPQGHSQSHSDTETAWALVKSHKNCLKVLKVIWTLHRLTIAGSLIIPVDVCTTVTC